MSNEVKVMVFEIPAPKMEVVEPFRPSAVTIMNLFMDVIPTDLLCVLPRAESESGFASRIRWIQDEDTKEIKLKRRKK